MRPIISLGTRHQLRDSNSLLLETGISTNSTQILSGPKKHMTLKITECYCGNSSHGIEGITNYWLKSYLLHASAAQHPMVRAQILYSEMIPQVPHSSILGLVLCLLYANVFLWKQVINVKYENALKQTMIINTKRTKTSSHTTQQKIH